MSFKQIVEPLIAAFQTALPSSIHRLDGQAPPLAVDMVMGAMFILFLMLFVLAGIYPAVKKTFMRVRGYLHKRGTPAGLDGGARYSRTMQAEVQQRWDFPQLGEYEELVLRHLATAGLFQRTGTAVAEELHVEPEIVHGTLASLDEKGMTWSLALFDFGRFYFLRPAGRHYAAMHGFYPIS